MRRSKSQLALVNCEFLMADQQTRWRCERGALSCKRGVASTCVNYAADFYEGLLEGLPTTAMNRRRVEGIIAECRASRGEEPLLIQPTEKPIEWERDTPYPFGEPAAYRKLSAWRVSIVWNRPAIPAWNGLIYKSFGSRRSLPFRSMRMCWIDCGQWIGSSMQLTGVIEGRKRVG